MATSLNDTLTNIGTRLGNFFDSVGPGLGSFIVILGITLAIIGILHIFMKIGITLAIIGILYIFMKMIYNSSFPRNKSSYNDDSYINNRYLPTIDISKSWEIPSLLSEDSSQEEDIPKQEAIPKEEMKEKPKDNLKSQEIHKWDMKKGYEEILKWTQRN